MHRAILIMLVAMSLIPLGDTAGKLMTDQSALSPFFAAWSRFAVGALILAFFVRRAAYKLLLDWRIIARASILVCGITSILTALSTVPIATVYAVFFIGPLISYILAVLFLKEPIGGLRLALVAGGFIGVVIVSQPQGQFDPNLLFAVLAGLCYGVFLALSRALSEIAPPVELAAPQLAYGAFVLLPFAVWNWPGITLELGFLGAVSGIASMAGNLLLIMAYALAPATRLASFVYFQIVIATISGAVVFDDWPNMLSWTGIAVILLCGGLSASRVSRPKAQPG